jgi:hypothetical protein
MTATCTSKVVDQLQLMTGILFLKPFNVFWPDANGMRRRTAFIHVRITNHVQSVLNGTVGLLIKPYKSSGQRKQFIVFGNSRVAIEAIYEMTRQFLNKHKYHGDLVLITGPMMKEQKFFYTDLFLNKTPPQNAEKSLASRTLDVVGCFATRALGSAGWDGKDVYNVVSIDLPTCILSLRQELGRCGRHEGANGETDKYMMIFSLRSIIYLIRRMYSPDDPNNPTATANQILTREQYRSLLWDNIIQVLQIFALPKECLHAALERRLANPYSDVDNMAVPIPPCKSMCDYCSGYYNKGLFPKVVHANVKRMLIDVFTGANSVLIPTIDDSFVKAIQKYPNARRFLFASKGRTKPELRMCKKLVILLLASKIITYRIYYDDSDLEKIKPIILARLNATDDGILYLNDDSAWALIPSKAALSE